MDIGNFLTTVLTIGTLIGNILVVLFLISYIAKRSAFAKVSEFMSQHALRLGFLIAFAATFGSIIYAQVTGYPACILCWIQRIFMYPEVALFGLALWKNDRAVLPYTLFLSVLGGVAALYNWIKDMLAMYTSVSLACPVVPGLPSCDRIYVSGFGYITIAMFALNAFIFIGIISYIAIRNNKNQTHE